MNTKRISEEIFVKCSEFLALHAIPALSADVHWRPHIRTMLNQTSLLFEQNLPGTDRIELIPSKTALIIVQKSPDNGTILYPRFVVNDN